MRLRALLVILALAARPATAQDSRLASLFNADALAVLTSVIDAARADRLPTEPLIQRALEGARRGVEPSRVFAAVRSLSDRMRVTRSAMGSASSDAELVAGAALLSLDVPSSVLEHMRKQSSGRDVSLPLIVMADIIERGVPRDTAAAVIASLGAARVADADYQMLRQSILLDIGAGTPAAAAASTRAQSILVGRGAVRRPPSR